MAVIASTGKERSWLAVLRRVTDSCWHGTTNNAEIAPLALNNESITAVNAAGTGTVALIKADASDVVTLPGAPTITGALTLSSTLSVAGTTTPTGGVVPVAGKPTPLWGAGFAPVVATSGTSTQGIANQQWISPLWVPANVTLTGLAFLIGTTGGTDKAIVSLYNNAGTLVANSTTASSGTTVGTAANLQSLDFTSTYAAVGPARYWAAVQTNGTAAYIMTIPAQTSVALVGTKSNTVAVPGATITVPTSFTAATGPIIGAY